ncbi:MAG TPA: transcription termination/antitermination protein NusA [Ruminococcus sp.]|nr:transcription termination/antitermination protein NusA [Ruminococcus sp.]
MDNNFFEVLSELGTENSVDTQVAIDSVKTAMQKAVQRMYPETKDKECVRVDIDPERKIFDVVLLQTIVDDEPINHTEVSIDEARASDPSAIVGGIFERKLDISKFGRASAQSAKQSIKGDLRDINRDKILEKFEKYEGDIITCTVTQVEPGRGAATLMYDKTELYLLRQDRMPNEVLREGMSIKVYVTKIANKNKKPIIKLSRVHKDLVKRLFEQEVPEIYDGTVEVKSISREAGSRSKIAVVSKDPNVDAIGACIGPKHSRISAIVRELNGEKIDIIAYSDNVAEYIAKALSPAKVLKVYILDNPEPEYDKDGNEKPPKTSAIAIVPESQLSLAIGNKGQNAKLAARLTGCKIDIKSDTEEFELPPHKEGVLSGTVDEEEDLFESASKTVSDAGTTQEDAVLSDDDEEIVLDDDAQETTNDNTEDVADDTTKEDAPAEDAS